MNKEKRVLGQNYLVVFFFILKLRNSDLLVQNEMNETLRGAQEEELICIHKETVLWETKK